MVDNTLIGAIIGGAISGVVGIIVARYTKKLENKELMKREVYDLLYEWFSTRLKNFEFMDEFVYANESKLKLTSYQYVKLDKKIREKFDTFVKEGEKWDEMYSSISNRFCRKDTGIFNEFIKPLKDSNIIRPNGYIMDLVNSDSFLTRFFSVLIDPSINNAETLYQRMKEYAEKKHLSELSIVEEIRKKRVEFFNLINQKLPELRDKILLDIKYEDLTTQATKTRYALSVLTDSLKKIL